MSQSHKEDFDIVSLIELCREKKYETCVAGFSTIDKIEKITLPKKLKNRKLTVQALYALTNDMVQWKYLSSEEKALLQAEKDKLAGVTSTAGTSFAPHAEEDIEEDFIPEEEARKPELEDGFEDEFGDDSDDDDDDSDDDDDFDDDSDDDSDDADEDEED
ncbi:MULTISPECIES: DNA primase [Leptospira]|uniref:DNA primase n=1 Tax=Leptospira congkakensis TaxID=2484932 RepID=A0A4Z0ZYD9_9LEPT|nr:MULTISPECIES: DNA primase [Leptospira]PJZ81848.1 DNA primase [Leptospira meyeri]PJZ97349.1 DNA primase [Leptospira meyeri]PKA11703.1 DNA primase [Leptospira meyeri]TGL15698.1 DNA primase [Leptospira meyeri]TGL92426.1 DNA primase [Leptospira congkakensis]